MYSKVDQKFRAEEMIWIFEEMVNVKCVICQ